MKAENNQELISKIEIAFADVDYPGDENLTNSFGDEADALVQEFTGKTDWHVLTADFLDSAPDGWASAISFFSGEALQFYLPAYLIADIKGLLKTTDASTRLSAFLSPQMGNKRLAKHYGGGTLGQHAREEFERFTAPQVKAVIAYLLWKLEQDGYNPMIEQALENYWLEREAELPE